MLLQNDGGALPFDATCSTIAVIGPNADATIIQGGGSARVDAAPAGLAARRAPRALRPTTACVHERGCFSFKRTPVLDARVLDGPLRVEYFAGREREGEPVLTRGRRRAGCSRSSARSVTACPTSSRCASPGTVVAPETGEWTFSLVQVGRARLLLDGEVVVDNWNPTGRSDAFMGFGSAEADGHRSS